MNYKGYKIKTVGPWANYAITTPKGNTWEDLAVTLKTAKKWIDCAIAELRKPMTHEEFCNSPYQPIEKLAAIAFDRCADGENQSLVREELLKTFGFEHQSCNGEMIARCCLFGSNHKTK